MARILTLLLLFCWVLARDEAAEEDASPIVDYARAKDNNSHPLRFTSAYPADALTKPASGGQADSPAIGRWPPNWAEY